MPERIGGDHHQGQALHAHRVGLAQEVAHGDLAPEEGHERPPGQDAHPAGVLRHRRPDATDGPHQTGRCLHHHFNTMQKCRRTRGVRLNVSMQGGRDAHTKRPTPDASKTGHADSPRQDSQRPAHSDHADVGGQESALPATERTQRAAEGAAAGRAARAGGAPRRIRRCPRADASRSGRARTGAPRTPWARATTSPPPTTRARAREKPRPRGR